MRIHTNLPCNMICRSVLLSHPSSLIPQRSSIAFFLRFKSTVPHRENGSPSPIPKESQSTVDVIPDHIRKTIPGFTEQPNTLISRIPRFPLRNTSTLIPKPGVPTAADTPLRSMMEILAQKKKPELIYEAEPHRLYFLVCGILAFIFSVYGFTFVDWGFNTVWQLYKEDGEPLMLVARLGMCAAISGIAIGIVTLSVKLPTRLVRRMWYLPGPKDHIRFTSHPLLPGRATPVYTIPLEDLVRSQKSKVFTKNGMYGTHDKSTFFFLLKEKNKRFGYWIVDRNAWFWGDGRVFDILFGKESLEEAQKGQSYNEKLKEASDALKEEREKQRKEHGPFWQHKLGKELVRNDLKKIVNIVGNKKNKLPKD